VSGLLDTNVLLYGANSDAPEHALARELLSSVGRTADSWYLTEGIVYEFLRVATHPKVFPAPLFADDALAFVRPLLESPNVHVLVAGEGHWSILDEVLAELAHPAGNLMFDVRTVALMREHGVSRVYTTDTDFLQFSGIEVVNPLRRRS
jgi:toxin-antitoxin system PIN domain toxin